MQTEADRLILDRYAPAGVIIDSDLQILQFRGRTGPYLEPAAGEASLNVLKMARPGLLLELRAAIHKAKRDEVPARAAGIRIRGADRYREVAIEVIPLKQPREEGPSPPQDRCFLVLFEEAAPVKAEADAKATGRSKSKSGGRTTGDADVEKLEQELAATKEYLQAIIEEQEATNEELQSTNEELLSSNEELQSINEELEAAKEELATGNDALAQQNGEVSVGTHDLVNLLASVNIAMVLLSRDLKIRRFTAQAERVLNLTSGHIGKPIREVDLKIDLTDLEKTLDEVLETLSSRERDVKGLDGRWYSMRARPYRTSDHRIDGVVIFFVDIDTLKRGILAAGGPAQPAD